MQQIDKKRKISDAASTPSKSARVGPEVNLPPWTKRNTTLHEEIHDFVRYVSAKPEEKLVREELVTRIEGLVKVLWPQAEVRVFGSLRTDLLLPTSDIDMVVLGAPVNALHRLCAALRKSEMYSSVVPITRAKVPILKLTDARTRYNMDVSFNIEGGIVNSKIVSSFLKEYPALRPLVLVLKHFLLQRGLNEPYSGGMGSYTLVLIVVHFLQTYSMNTRETSDLGVLLRDFFEFYGTKFNYYCCGLSVQNGGSYFQKKKYSFWNPDRPYLLCVQDPQDSSNDVGKNSWQIMQVRQCFQYALKALDIESFGPTPLSRILQPDPKAEALRETISRICSKRASK